MDSLNKGIEFDITYLPDEYWVGDLEYRASVTHVLLGVNAYTRKIVQNYVYRKPRYESPECMIYCDHNDWIQYQLIKHLPYETIIQYFEEKHNEHR